MTCLCFAEVQTKPQETLSLMLVFEDPALTAKKYFGSSQEKGLEGSVVRNCIKKWLPQLKFLTSEKALLQPQAVQFSLSLLLL